MAEEEKLLFFQSICCTFTVCIVNSSESELTSGEICTRRLFVEHTVFVSYR